MPDNTEVPLLPTIVSPSLSVRRFLRRTIFDLSNGPTGSGRHRCHSWPLPSHCPHHRKSHLDVIALVLILPLYSPLDRNILFSNSTNTPLHLVLRSVDTCFNLIRPRAPSRQSNIPTAFLCPHDYLSSTYPRTRAAPLIHHVRRGHGNCPFKHQRPYCSAQSRSSRPSSCLRPCCVYRVQERETTATATSRWTLSDRRYTIAELLQANSRQHPSWR